MELPRGSVQQAVDLFCPPLAQLPPVRSSNRWITDFRDAPDADRFFDNPENILRPRRDNFHTVSVAVRENNRAPREIIQAGAQCTTNIQINLAMLTLIPVRTSIF